MEIEEIKKIIESSFLSKEKKTELITFLAHGERTPAFWQKFDELLTNDAQERLGAYNTYLKQYIAKRAELAENIQKQTSALITKRDQGLEHAGDNLLLQQKIWQEYYIQAEKFMDEEEQRAKITAVNIIANLSVKN